MQASADRCDELQEACTLDDAASVETDKDRLRALRIKAERSRLGFSQQEFADRLEVSVKTVGRWEAGRAAPRGSNLRALAKVTGKAITWFGSDFDPSRPFEHGSQVNGYPTEDRIGADASPIAQQPEAQTEPPDAYWEILYHEWVSRELQTIAGSLDATSARLGDLNHRELIELVHEVRDAVFRTAQEEQEEAESLSEELASANGANASEHRTALP